MENTKEDNSIEFRLMRLVGYLGVPTAAMAYLLYYLFNNYIPSHEAMNERRMVEIRSDYTALQKSYSEQLLKILDEIKDLKLMLGKTSQACEKELGSSK